MRKQLFRLHFLVLSGVVTAVLGLVTTESKAAGPRAATTASSAAETRASRAYQAAVHQGPLAVQAFLAEFPKGADLHFHLSAGVYAETLIRFAAEDKVCIDPAKAEFARDGQGRTLKEPCASPLIPAAELNGSRLTPKEQDLYDHLSLIHI